MRIPFFFPHLFSVASASLFFFGAIDLHAQTYLFDFGGNGTQMDSADDPVRLWNNVPVSVGAAVNSSISAQSTDGSGNLLTLTIKQRFNGDNANGTLGSSLYPTDATRDSLYGNTLTFNNFSAPNPTFTLSGLDPQKAYNFTFYASRVGAGGDIRTTDYFVTGSLSGSTTLNVSENVNNTASVFNITPTALGEITVSLAAAASNTNANKFIYLGVLELQAIPEPGTAALLLCGCLVAFTRRNRKSGSAVA